MLELHCFKNQTDFAYLCDMGLFWKLMVCKLSLYLTQAGLLPSLTGNMLRTCKLHAQSRGEIRTHDPLRQHATHSHLPLIQSHWHHPVAKWHQAFKKLLRNSRPGLIFYDWGLNILTYTKYYEHVLLFMFRGKTINNINNCKMCNCVLFFLVFS